MALKTPCFAECYDVHHIEGVGTFLLSERPPVTLSGRIYTQVCPLVDGTRTVTEIVAQLHGELAPAEVYYALGLLHKQGHVRETGRPTVPGLAAHWQVVGSDDGAEPASLSAQRVEVVALGRTPDFDMQHALATSGMQPAERRPDATLIVAIVDDYRQPELTALIDAAGGIPVLPVRLLGVTAWLGPVIGGPSQACWSCLLRRIRLNDPIGAFVEANTGRTPVPARAALPTAVTAAGYWAATAIAHWAITGSPELAQNMLSLSAADATTAVHAVPHDPFCPDCGQPPADWTTAELAPPELRAQPYQASPSGHRSVSAASTLREYEHLVSPITGVVSGMHCISPAEDPLVHAYTASHNWALDLSSLDHVRRSLRSMSGGKGTTDEEARVGALAEAFERYSGVCRGDEPVRVASFAELAAEGAVHPDTVQLYSAAQMVGRVANNAHADTYHMVPEPFDESAATAWSPAWSLTDDAPRWVPTGLAYYAFDHTPLARSTANAAALRADSNGCAAGSTYEEAALQGLLELVERDAVALWWYNRIRRPALDLTVAPGYVHQVVENLDVRGRDLWVLDLTSDIGIPVCAAISALREPRDDSQNIVLGFGAHLDPQIALLRAVTELNQFRAAFATVTESHLSAAFEPGAVSWWRTATLDRHPYLRPAADAARALSAFAALTSADLLEELRTAVAMVQARGPDVMFLDQTRPEVGMPVVRALAPGLRHFWARFAPGRLYDAPVALGWLDQPTPEADLNPIPVFF